MIDNMDGTVTYSKKEIENINNFLNMIYNKITEYKEGSSDE